MYKYRTDLKEMEIYRFRKMWLRFITPVMIRTSSFAWRMLGIHDSGSHASYIHSGGSISYLGLDIDCTDWGLHGFPQSLQGNGGILPWNRSQPLRSTSFPIRHSLIILSFDAVWSELLKESLNKAWINICRRRFDILLFSHFQMIYCYRGSV
jgi:hypothetical protein